MPKVRLYTTATCAYCAAEKEFLEDHQIPVEEIAVDQDPDALEEMVHLSGQLGVPFAVIERDDGTRTAVLGFDQPLLKQALGLV